MDSKKQKEISDVLQQFNRQVTKLFKIVDLIVPGDPNIDWARPIVSVSSTINNFSNARLGLISVNFSKSSR